MNCKICGKPLHMSQYEMCGRYKSCPKCSEMNGEEHIFFNYPEAFGRSDKRETSNHPDGPQSYCYIHRQNQNREIPVGGILCSELES